MARAVVILLAIASTASADGLPYGSGPCDDADACEQACATDAAACTWGGHLVLRSGLDVPQHRARAGKLYERACAKGNAEGCWRAGLLADPGTGNRHRARALYDLACTRKLVRACFALVKVDGGTGGYERGLAIETAACRAKDVGACERARSILMLSLSAKPDDKRLAKVDDLACIARTGSPCPPPPPPPKCDDAIAAQKAQQAATTTTAQSYADALALQNLQPITLKRHGFNRYNQQLEVRPGQTWAVDHVVDVRIANRGAWQQLVVGFDTWSHCAPPDRNEFVQSGDRIYRVERAPRVVSTRSFTLCGCGPMCGGAAPAQMATAFELPPGTTFGGKITVPYDEERVTLHYLGRCAPPP